MPEHGVPWGYKNPSSCETKTYLFYIVNIMAADDLTMQGAKASATMISTMLDCHGCWWPCDARSQGISNHDIYYVDLSWLLMTLQHKEPGHQQPWYLLCWPVMAADDLATQGARASATMIFTMLNRINFIPTGEWLSCTCMHTLVWLIVFQKHPAIKVSHTNLCQYNVWTTHDIKSH